MSEPVTEPEPVAPEPETPEEGDLPEEPLGEPGEEPETPQEPVQEPAEAPQGPSEAQMEQQGKDLDRAARAYTDKLVKALGDDLGGWHPCPLCADGYPGIRLPVMPSPDALAAVKAEIGEPVDPPLQDDPYSQRCDKCDGWGKVLTGSKVPGRTTAVCADCNGDGWKSTDERRKQGHVLAANGATLTVVPEASGLPGELPPEAEALKALGYIVVAPIAPPVPA